MKENKTKIIIGITIIIVLLFIVIGIFIKNSVYKKYAEEAEIIYNDVHELYYYGGNVAFSADENGERIILEKDENKYYQISNFQESVSSYFTKEKLNDVMKYLNIVEQDGNYYMKDIGRGISNYFGTELTVKKAKSKKRIFKAVSTFCKIGHQTTYGDGCEGDNEYTIEKEFTIIKENNNWIVSEYTSIFEFTNELQ